MNGKPYTQKEWAGIVEAVKTRFTYKEIAEMTGRTEIAIASRCRKYKVGVLSFMPKEEPAQPEPAHVEQEPRKMTLNDFKPREMIKHLYDLGYRIRGGDIYQIVERKVLLNDIIGQ